MDQQWELSKGDLTRTIIIKDIPYGMVEFTMKTVMVDEEGRVIIDRASTSFFDTDDFKKFFQPIVNELKVRFDNDSSNSI